MAQFLSEILRVVSLFPPMYCSQMISPASRSSHYTKHSLWTRHKCMETVIMHSTEHVIRTKKCLDTCEKICSNIYQNDKLVEIYIVANLNVRLLFHALYW